MIIKEKNQFIWCKTYAYGTSKDLVCKKEEIKTIQKCLTLINLQKKT